jgi:uncharacterized membrane protein
MSERNLFYILRSYKGRIIGLVAGFIVAILLIIFGFFKTLIIVILTTLGWFIGRKFDGNTDSFLEMLDKITNADIED